MLAIDDGSTDESADIVRRYAQADRRIRLLQPGRIGLVTALNLGIEQARSPIIARMDADDLMHPDRLQSQYAYLNDHPEIALVASQVELFPADLIHAGCQEYVRWQNLCLEPAGIAASIYVESPFAHPSVMFRHAIVERLGGYRAEITRMRSFECVSVIRCNIAEQSSALVAPSA